MTKDRYRLSLQLDKESWDSMNAVTKKSGLKSKARAVRTGLRLLDIYHTANKSGGSLILKNKDGTQERIVII